MLDLNIQMFEPKIANYLNILIKAHKQKNYIMVESMTYCCGDYTHLLAL